MASYQILDSVSDTLSTFTDLLEKHPAAAARSLQSAAFLAERLADGVVSPQLNLLKGSMGFISDWDSEKSPEFRPAPVGDVGQLAVWINEARTCVSVLEGVWARFTPDDFTLGFADPDGSGFVTYFNALRGIIGVLNEWIPVAEGALRAARNGAEWKMIDNHFLLVEAGLDGATASIGIAQSQWVLTSLWLAAQPQLEVEWTPRCVQARSVPILREHPGFEICESERRKLERQLRAVRTDEKRLEKLILIIVLFEIQLSGLEELDKRCQDRPANDRYALSTWALAWIEQAEDRYGEYVKRRDRIKAQVPDAVPVVMKSAEKKADLILALIERAEPE